ncbi:hypothetical protein [Dactylosporangium sp. NPDC051484]|uniref:hypothetical protein n=1 Tax=Dactylosporangium sp. NPDC051484 TaxID=3154942 RepID=UPI00344DC8FA
MSGDNGDTVANAGSADTPLTMSMIECVPESGCAATRMSGAIGTGLDLRSSRQRRLARDRDHL